jgi:hypothetical protein
MSQHSIRTRPSRSRVVGIAAVLAVGGIGLSACSSGRPARSRLTR